MRVLMVTEQVQPRTLSNGAFLERVILPGFDNIVSQIAAWSFATHLAFSHLRAILPT